MKTLFSLVFCLLATPLFSQKTINRFRIKPGDWRALLHLDESNSLPFGLHVERRKKEYYFTVINGEEQIQLVDPVYQGDSLVLGFPFFHSEIVITELSKKSLRGNWYNHNKNENYHIPFSAYRENTSRFAINKGESYPNIDGRWEIAFEPNTPGAYPAVGLFSQDGQSLTGTFLTETGDYRFLEGNSTSDSVYLSCFDGSHAFLFKSRVVGDSIYGEFFSGNHWRSDWRGRRNEAFEIESPEDLTYVLDDQKLKFTLKSLSGEPFVFPNEQFENKVTIIQIMGSWCPNCLDETLYFQELYNEHHDSGLEIIAIGYEVGDDFNKHAESIKRLQKKLGIKYTMIVGGAASKSLASADFSMLNEVISFPTSIFIGKDGSVRRVHTGFNGPGTGSYYTEYILSTNKLVKSLLEE